MLACFVPVCSKTPDVEAVQGGKARKSVASKHGLRLFTFQLKQMASRFTSGALYRNCRPACTTLSRNDLPNDDPGLHPSSEEMQSPQFSLKSYQMNSQTPSRQEIAGTPDNNRFGGAESIMRSVQGSFADAAVNRDGANVDKVAVPGCNKILDDEWVAQVEPGVYITFCTAQDGFNDLKRIKFSRDLFSKQHAETWWTENCPMIRELYNVRPPSSANADDDRLSSGYATPDTYSKSPCSTVGRDYQLTRRKSAADSRFKEDLPISDSQKNEVTANYNSWVEQDEAGVYLTILTAPGLGKQLKRIRFSREKFSEKEAAAWWEHNRQRIYAQYIFTTTKLQCK